MLFQDSTAAILLYNRQYRETLVNCRKNDEDLVTFAHILDIWRPTAYKVLLLPKTLIIQGNIFVLNVNIEEVNNS